MKKFYKILLVASLGAIALSSCEEKIDPIVTPETSAEPILMKVIPGPIQTKTYLEADGANYKVKWSAGDMLGVYEVGDGVVASDATTSTALAADAATAEFTFDFSANSDLNPNYSYVFVYPAHRLSYYSSKKIYEGQIHDTQTFSATTFDKNADLLISEGLTGQASRPATVNVAFERIGATALMNIKAPTTDEKISSVTFSTTEGNIAGYIQIDPAAGTHETTLLSSGAKSSITLYPASSTEFTGTIPVWFRLGAIDLSDNFTVTVTTNKHVYTKTVDLATLGKTVSFKNSGLTKFNVDMTSVPKGTDFIVGTHITSIFPTTVDGVKFTYAKGSGTTDPLYASPFNWYKNSTVTISAGSANITKVVFTYTKPISDANFASDDDDSSYSQSSTTGTWTVGSDAVSSVTFTNKGDAGRFSRFTVYCTGTPDEAVVTSTPTVNFASEAEVAIGTPITRTATSNFNNGTITYSSLDESIATVDPSTGEITGLVAGTTTIRATVAGVTTDYVKINSAYADCALTVTAAATWDVLDYSWAGVEGTGYTAWTNKGGTYSGAIYAGSTAGGNNAIQLNSGSPRGIISTTSGGYISKVAVVWNSSKH